jgi:hypothetical protein
MNFHKIFKIIAAVLSLTGVVFLALIISKGDEAIQLAAAETGMTDYMSYVGYIVLAIVVALVIFFVIKNLFTNTGSLKSTLIGIGAFAAVLIIAYLVSGGDTTIYKHSEGVASATDSHMVGAGLIAFYVLAVVAIGAMLLSGVKKIFNK